MIVNLNLVFHQERAGLVIVADLRKFHFVGHRRRKPRAPNDSHFAAAQFKFRDIVLEPNDIIDAWATHKESSMNSLSPTRRELSDESTTPTE